MECFQNKYIDVEHNSAYKNVGTLFKPIVAHFLQTYISHKTTVIWCLVSTFDN